MYNPPDFCDVFIDTQNEVSAQTCRLFWVLIKDINQRLDQINLQYTDSHVRHLMYYGLCRAMKVIQWKLRKIIDLEDDDMPVINRLHDVSIIDLSAGLTLLGKDVCNKLVYKPILDSIQFLNDLLDQYDLYQLIDDGQRLYTVYLPFKDDNNLINHFPYYYDVSDDTNHTPEELQFYKKYINAFEKYDNQL
ncbi:Uncharacterised protein [uncultured archaeon]|nr:Uncharacterised protein [uncultured archaeon]